MIEINSIQDVITAKEKDATSLGYKHRSSEDYVKKLVDEIEYLYKVKKKSYGDDEKLKNLKESLVDNLENQRNKLSDDECQKLVIKLIRSELFNELESIMNLKTDELTSLIQNWIEKYGKSYAEIELELDESKVRLKGFLKGLGYE